MNKFKVGDIVELDEKHNDFGFASSISGLQGHLKITDICSQNGFLYFDGTLYNSYFGGWYSERFKLVEAAEQPKPIKKPHAWVTIEKSSGKVTSMRITRKAIRFQQKLNRKLDKGTVIRKITYDVV